MKIKKNFYEPKLKTKSGNLMGNAKDTMKLGIVNTTGINILGQVGKSVPAASGTINTAAAGLNILQTGQFAKNAMGINEMFSSKKAKKTRRK